jgi:N-acetylglutamate synthase-like GNAT family acetyltransferase
MKITTYKSNPKTTAEIVDLVNFCQNIEAGLGLTMAEQYDLFEIEDHYQKIGGQFWTAIEDDKVVGTISLLPLNSDTAVLKKFFTYPDFRGEPEYLGKKLYEEFIEFAKEHNFKTIVLDSPGSQKRAHHFYRNQGFKEVTEDELTVSWSYPHSNSKFFQSELS